MTRTLLPGKAKLLRSVGGETHVHERHVCLAPWCWLGRGVARGECQASGQVGAARGIMGFCQHSKAQSRERRGNSVVGELGMSAC